MTQTAVLHGYCEGCRHQFIWEVEEPAGTCREWVCQSCPGCAFESVYFITVYVEEGDLISFRALRRGTLAHKFAEDVIRDNNLQVVYDPPESKAIH